MRHYSGVALLLHCDHMAIILKFPAKKQQVPPLSASSARSSIKLRFRHRIPFSCPVPRLSNAALIAF